MTVLFSKEINSHSDFSYHKANLYYLVIFNPTWPYNIKMLGFLFCRYKYLIGTIELFTTLKGCAKI